MPKRRITIDMPLWHLKHEVYLSIFFFTYKKKCSLYFLHICVHSKNKEANLACNTRFIDLREGIYILLLRTLTGL